MIALSPLVLRVFLSSSRVHRVVAVLVASVVLSFAVLVEKMNHDAELSLRRAGVLDSASTIAGRLQEIVLARLGLAQGLSALVRSSDGIVEPALFRLYAQNLVAGLSDVRSLQLAPDGIVTRVYPESGNEQALGHRIRQDPLRAQAVERAIRDRTFVIAGPLRLIQGGYGLVARMPIYVAAEGGDERFWGFATVVLDMEPLLDKGGVTAGSRHLDIAIRGRDGLGAAGEVIHGDERVFEASPEKVEVKLPEGAWLLAAVPAGGWPGRQPISYFIWLGGVLTALVSGLLTHHLLSEPVRLRRTVHLVTHTANQERLRAEEACVKARTADAAKTRFLAAASHDLRQPLQAVNLYAAALRSHLAEPRGVAILDRLDSALTAMGGLLRAILDISKIDAGHIVPQESAFALAPLIGRMAAEIEPVCARKNLRLRVASTSAWVRSDPALLEIILRNLVQNAAKYTTAGGILIGVRRSRAGLRLCVVDTGIGIPPEHLDAIFEEFAQLDNSARNSEGGLGLGLSIVERLARLLGHRVVVRSRPERGSVFAIELPQAQERSEVPLKRVG